MLRVSALSTNNSDLNLFAITDSEGGPSGVDGGESLLAFTEAAVECRDQLPTAREYLRSELGEAALVDAAAVIGNFERMTRIADGAGIPMDVRNLDYTREVRETLDLEKLVSTRLPHSY